MAEANRPKQMGETNRGGSPDLKRPKLNTETNQGVSPDLIPVTVWGVIFNFLPVSSFINARKTCKLFKSASYQKHAWTHLRIPQRNVRDILVAFEKEGHPLEYISTYFHYYRTNIDHLKTDALSDEWWKTLSKMSNLKVLKREDDRCLDGLDLPLSSMWSETLEELDLFQCHLLDFPNRCFSKEETKMGASPFLKLKQLTVKPCSFGSHQSDFLEKYPDFEPILKCLAPIISQTCILESLDIQDVSRPMAYDILLHTSGFARHLNKLVLSVSKKSNTIICASAIGLDFPNLLHLEMRNIPNYLIATDMCQPMTRLKLACWTDPSRNSSFAKISVLRNLQCLGLEVLEMDNLEIWRIPKLLDLFRHLKRLEAGPVYCEPEAIDELGINQKVVKLIQVVYPKPASEYYSAP
jgi:hypothetical protein